MENNQLPADVQERIKAEADKAYPLPTYPIEHPSCMHKREGYIAGATAEHERAQKLSDALSGCIGTIIFWYEVLSQTEGFGIMEAEYLEAKNQSIKRIETALQQWKGEGKGKEDKVYRPCPHCGKELFRDRNLCCRACGKEVGE